MSEENLKLWNAVREVPKEAQKPIKGGRLSGMTDINPIWRVKAITEQYGPCGIGWKYTVDKRWTEKGCHDQVVVFVDVSVFIKHDGQWSEGIPGTGGSMLTAKEKNGPHTSDECFKMATTDAIGVSLKFLGLGSDIYWQGQDCKYYRSEKAEYLGSPTPPPIKNLDLGASQTRITGICKATNLSLDEFDEQIAIEDEHVAAMSTENRQKIKDYISTTRARYQDAQ